MPGTILAEQASSILSGKCRNRVIAIARSSSCSGALHSVASFQRKSLVRRTERVRSRGVVTSAAPWGLIHAVAMIEVVRVKSAGGLGSSFGRRTLLTQCDGQR